MNNIITHRIKKAFYISFTMLAFLMACCSSILPLLKTQKTYADSNPASWVLCKTTDGQQLYNAATTDNIPYYLRSKSDVTTTDDMNSLLNQILEASGYNFEKVNESILGRKIQPDPDSATKNTASTKNQVTNPNAKAAKVNPFDRFGVAGLHWSSYTGEWKYYYVNGCQSDTDTAAKIDFGKFYDGREEPKTTYDDIGNSKDPRVQQYNKGASASWANAFYDAIANGLFSIIKLVVVLTIALISFSFSDITDIIGLTSSGSNNGDTFVSIFNNLYSGFFLPLVIMAILGTAMFILWNGLIKRQIRYALVNGLGTVLVCFVLATMISANPNFWIPLPNRIFTYGQSLVVSALGQSANSGGDLCSTNVGSTSSTTKINVNDNSSTSDRAAQMAKIGTNMKSVIGCRLWEEFLFKPWVRGQFGTEYSKLYAAGTKGATIMNNVNKSWVGSASVPLGGNTVIHNWALYQLSTQTEAHAQTPKTNKTNINNTGSGTLNGATDTTSDNSNVVKKVDGVSSDWWRIVDALSNYNEEFTTTKVTSGSNDVTTTEQQETQPMSVWQSWIGNRSYERIGTAILSIIFGGIGILGPLVFSFMSAVYSIGVTFLMALSPIFLLFGCWAGPGTKIFRSWLEALISVGVKKIVCSGLLLLSFSLSMAGISLIDKIGWIQAFLLMFVMSVVLLKNRHRILEAFSKIDLGGVTNLISPFNKVIDKQKNRMRATGRFANSTASGALMARQFGMKASEGAKLGARLEAHNIMRKSTLGRQALIQMNNYGDFSPESLRCVMCGRTLIPGTVAFTDENGDFYCTECVNDLGMYQNLYEVHLPKARANSSNDKRHESVGHKLKRINKQRIFRKYTKDDVTKNKVKSDQKGGFTNLGSKNTSWLSYGKTQQMMDLKRDDKNNLYWNNSNVQNMITDNLDKLENDMHEFYLQYEVRGETVIPPAIPEPLSGYIDNVKLLAAWQSGRKDIVRSTYKLAWMKWYNDNAAGIHNVDNDTQNVTDKVIDRYQPKQFQDYQPNNGNPNNTESNDNSNDNINDKNDDSDDTKNE